MSSSAPFSSKTRIFLGSIIVILAFLLLAGGWTIPFKFESFSILYKFGMEKTYLRSGKMVSITVVLLVFYQVLLASKFAFFEQVFSVKRLLFMHRINGMIIACLVVLHPVLIKASENFTPYTFEKKYYPEFLGIIVLAVLLSLSVTAVFRNFFKLSYGNWLLLHRFGATLLLILLPSHILFVSETFKSGLPRNAAMVIMSLNLFMVMRILLQRLTPRGK